MNKKQQVKNSFIYLLPIVAGNLLPFITLPIFTRVLTPEDYGVLALVSIYGAFVSGLANAGMTAAYERNFFQYRNNRLQSGQLLFSILLFVIFNFLALAGVTYAFRGILSKLIIGSVEHGDILFWVVCAQSFSSAGWFYLTYFKNSEKVKDFVFYTIARSLIYLTISLFLVAYLRVGLIGIVFAQLFSDATIFGILSYKFATSLKLSLNREIFIDSLKIAYPLTPRIFLGFIATQFDKYVVGQLDSVGGAGVYSIGQKFSILVFDYMTAIQNVFSPQVYKRMFDYEENGGEAIGRYLTPFVYISILVGLMVSLLSEEVLFILTPPAYHEAVNIVIILSMYYGFMFFGKLTGTQLIFMKKTHITSLLTIVSIGITIGLVIPFVLKWGATGAAWGTFLASLISGGISFGLAQHYYEIKWEYKKVGLIFITFFGASLSLILLRDTGISYLTRVAFKSVFLALYAYLGVVFGIISKENYLLVIQLGRDTILDFKRLYMREKSGSIS